MRALYPALAALFIILGVPVLFLSVPAAGMFLPVVALWIVVTSIVIGGAYLAFGHYGVLAASGMFFAIVAWAIGRGVIGPGVTENTRCSVSAAMTLQPTRITRPARVVFDDVQRIVSYDRSHPYHPLETVAVVTGAEVVEIERLARGHIGEAWSTKVSPGSVCTASGSRNTIRTADGLQPQRLDLCLTRTKLFGLLGADDKDARCCGRRPFHSVRGQRSGRHGAAQVRRHRHLRRGRRCQAPTRSFRQRLAGP